VQTSAPIGAAAIGRERAWQFPFESAHQYHSLRLCPDPVCKNSRVLERRSAPWDGNRDVAEFQAPGVVALNVEGAGLAFVGIQRTGDAFDFLVVNRGDPNANNRYGTAHQRDVERLPLAWRSR
jgi:hypothetical protein